MPSESQVNDIAVDLTGRKGEPGFVYVLSNRSLRPGLVKIGFTTLHPLERALQLTKEMRLPHPFEVASAVYVSDCKKAERWLHKAFSKQRVSLKREFFDARLEDVAVLLSKLMNSKFSELDKEELTEQYLDSSRAYVGSRLINGKLIGQVICNRLASMPPGTWRFYQDTVVRLSHYYYHAMLRLDVHPASWDFNQNCFYEIRSQYNRDPTFYPSGEYGEWASDQDGYDLAKDAASLLSVALTHPEEIVHSGSAYSNTWLTALTLDANVRRDIIESLDGVPVILNFENILRDRIAIYEKRKDPEFSGGLIFDFPEILFR